MGFVQRAFTPGGGEAPEAIAQRAAGQARIDAEAAAKAAAQLKPPTLPTAPSPPPVFQPGQAAGARQRAALGAQTLLGAAATGGEMARAGASGQKRSVLG